MQFMEKGETASSGTNYELFYDAFNASPIGIAVEDFDGRPLYVNPALCSMLGFSQEEMRSKHCVEFSPPEDAQKDWALFQQLRSGSIDRYSMEKRFFRRDGSLTWGRLNISLLNHRPAPLVVAIVEDISPVRESEERFRYVANSAPVMIWMSGPDRLCTYVNRPWLEFTGRTMEEELGNGWLDSVHPDDRQRCVDIYARALERREPFTMDYRLRRHDGEYRWVLDSGVPRFDRDGSFEGYIGSAVDETDRKRLNEALSNLSGRLLEAQEQERRHIARELHDDISQQIAVLSLELHRLQTSLPDSETTIRDRIDSLMKRTSEVATDLHLLSHRLHSSRLETLGLVASARGYCAELAEQRNVEIYFTHSRVPAVLPEAISLCLFRVLQEALNNAVKHSGVRCFEADLERVAEELQLTVRDRGIGFDPEVAMYNQGIGLISMRERLSLVKGTMSIVSKPQEGTEIRFRVPLFTSSAAAEAPNETRSSAAPAKSAQSSSADH
jgi:PAS domain S-box-containing protein